MANKVFANGMEVACKASSGTSIAAFPDVCMTPPTAPPTPPGVPIPYPNTGMASDTTGGSKTVKMHGKEVMLKNKSCFKKSVGNEAGAAPKKGVVTSKTSGKVYFNAWSMDVKVEGENVVRNLDITTGNHASGPGNSAPTGHVSGAAPPRPANDPKCKMKPYSEGCDGNETPHHAVPDHCFKEKGKGGAYYPGAVQHADGLCICVEGATKSSTPKGGNVRKKDFATAEAHVAALAEHGRIHLKFDKLERELGDRKGSDGKPTNTATLGELEDKAAESISEVTGCDKNDLKKQMRKHHEDRNLGPETKLRADPYGRRANPTGPMGTNQTPTPGGVA